MIRVGVVGLGYWGPNLARNFAAIAGLRAGVVLRRVREPPASAGRRRSRAPASPPSSTTCSPIPTLDAVVLATPVPTHGPLAERVLQAGKHCFVEKPLAYTVEDAERAVAAAAAADRILMVGHLLVYHPGVEMLKEIADSGELGDIHYIYSQRLNLGKLRTDENALWSLGAHDVSVSCTSPARTRTLVEARGEAYTRPGVEDVVFAFLRFPSGVAAHLHMSWLDPHKTRAFTVVGSKRMATFDDMELERKVTDLRQGLRRGRALLRRVHHPLGRHPQPADRQPRAAADRVRALRRLHPRGHAARAPTAKRGCASCACSPRCRRASTRRVGRLALMSDPTRTTPGDPLCGLHVPAAARRGRPGQPASGRRRHAPATGSSSGWWRRVGAHADRRHRRSASARSCCSRSCSARSSAAAS